MECYYHMDISGWELVSDGCTFQIKRDQQGAYWLALKGTGTANPTIAIEISSEEMESILHSKEPDEEAKKIDPGTHRYVHVR